MFEITVGNICARCEQFCKSLSFAGSLALRELRSRLAITDEKAIYKGSILGTTWRGAIERLEPRLALDSTMVFNEIMYNPGGSEDDTLEWVELYNQLAIDIDISEWAIEGGVDYQFPDGTVLPGRSYLVVAIDPAALQAESAYSGALGPFTGRLSNGGDELRIVNNDGRVMNVLDYGDDGDWPVGPDGGGASLAKRDPHTSTEATDNWTSSITVGGTPGAVNFPNAPAPAYPIALNEIAAATANDFWLEIVNQGTQSVNLSGVELVATGTGGGQYTFPAQSIAPGEYLQVTEAQLGFHPIDGEKLFLYAPGGQHQLLDAQVVTNRLRGRSDELAGAWLYPDVSTPSAANSFQLHDEIVINEIMYHAFPKLSTPDTPATFETTTLLAIDEDTLWRFNPTGNALPANWAQASHAVDGIDWLEGPALIGYDSTPGAIPGTIRTVLDPPQGNIPYIFTYYFEIDFQFSGDPSEIDALELGHVIDDGAVFYLNGVELEEARFGMNPGPVNAGTTASSTVGDAGFTGPITVSTDSLIVGTNRLSVEVHQSNNGSSDIIFGAELRARKQISEPIPGEPFTESDEEWIELYNRGTAPVDLGGWSLADAVDFEIPAGTVLAPGEYLVVARDAASLQNKYPAIEIVGDFSRSLSDREDRILLIDASGNPADEVHYFESGRWSLYADGGGSSLELRDPDADNNRAEAWAPSDESTKSTWQTYTYRAVSSEPMSVGANLQQFILGLLDEGELLLDDVSVIRDPDGANQQVIVNGSFENDAVGSTPAGWRLVGNHGSGSVQLDGSNKVLHLIAEGPQQHIHDHVTVDFGNGESIQDGQEYEISLRAKWLAGSAQLNNRFYFTRMANTFILDVPENNGTPGARNSAFESNVGPTYSDLVQNPVLPAAGQPVTISVRADDPEGISAINLKYAVNEGGFSTLPMTLGGDGLFKATIPGQSISSTVQFYVEGSDALGAVSTFPAAGAASRALYFVGAGSATASPIDTVRIIMLGSDRNNLTVRYNEMSNQYIGASIVHTIDSANGPINVAYHDVEVRQVGSRFVRPNSGYKIRLRPDEKFYGVHESIRLDMSNIGEIYMKHMVARAGGSSVSMYDDVAVMVDPRHGTRTVLLQLARYEDDYLREQFADGNEGTKWELDDIVIPTEPVQLGYNNDLAITNQDIRYRGPDPESYRGQLLIKNQRYKDDYQAIVDFAWAIHRTNQQELYDATNAVMDVDLWMRHYATQSFLGNWDTYGFGRPKNLRIYVRPEDGMIIPLYWDADLGNLTEPLIWNGNVSRLDEIRDIPQNLRLFWGHMWDLTNRSFNGDYMVPWLAYYSQLGVGMPSAGQLNSRANSARSQAQSAIPTVSFQITTNGGNNFSVDELSATLEGTGWIDVRNVYLAGSDVPLEVTWTGINTWQLEVPLAPGANQVTLQAHDFEAGLIASDTITITSTVPDRPLYDYLRITELHYHPQQAAEHEFIEVTNTGEDAVNLAGVQIASFASEPYVFSSGITLEAGQRIVVARNPNEFVSYYGTGINMAPSGYADANLSNGGEIISLIAPGGEVLQYFQFYDSGDWPLEADGQGPSLEYVGPFDQDSVDPMTIGGDPYDNPAYWKASRQVGGTPGIAPTQIAGDYDYSGVVDSGDHAVWRSSYGISALIVGAGADGNFDGVINAADYVVWRKNLGTSLPAPALAAFVVSGEPAAPRASAPLSEPQLVLAVAAAIHSPRNESPFDGDGAQVKSTSVTAVGEDRQAAFGLLSRLRQFTRLGNEANEVTAEPIRYEAPEELVEELSLLAEEEDPFAVWDEV